jgi:hypothetical protein
MTVEIKLSNNLKTSLLFAKSKFKKLKESMKNLHLAKEIKILKKLSLKLMK